MSKTRRAVKPSEEAGQAPAVSNRRLAGGAPRPLRAPHRAAGHERSAGGPEAAGPSRPPPSDSRWTDLGGAKLRRWGTPCLPLPGASPERGKEGGDGVRRRRRRRRRRRVRRPPPTRSWQEPLPEPPGHPRDRSVWSPQGAAGPPGGTMQPLWTAPSRPPLSVPAKPGRLQVAPGVGGVGGGGSRAPPALTGSHLPSRPRAEPRRKRQHLTLRPPAPPRLPACGSQSCRPGEDPSAGARKGGGGWAGGAVSGRDARTGGGGGPEPARRLSGEAEGGGAVLMRAGPPEPEPAPLRRPRPAPRLRAPPAARLRSPTPAPSFPVPLLGGPF